MVIKFLGHSAFKIKGKDITLITDPFHTEMVGIKTPKIPAEIVTISHQHQDHNNAALIEGEPFIIDGPGDYEVKGVYIHGFSTFHDDKSGKERGKNTVYKILMDGITLVHCGDLGHLFSDEQLDEMEEVDVLFVPAGGVYTINPRTAAAVVKQIEPRIVIPMHYQESRLNQNNFGSLQPVKAFLSEMGKEEGEAQEKLTVLKSGLPEETEIIVLK